MTVNRIDPQQIDKIFLRKSQIYTGILVPNGQNFVILSVAGSAAPVEIASLSSSFVGAAVVSVTTGSNSLTNDPGTTALSPRNLVQIRDNTTKSLILSSGKEIYALLQTDTATTNGDHFDDGSKKVQLSFVKQNLTGDGLVAVSSSDIQNKTINYEYGVRYLYGSTDEEDYFEPVFQEPLTAGSGGITELEHETLRQLIHLAEGGPWEGFSNAYREILPCGVAFPTSFTWWDSSAKNFKIIEKTISYDGNKRPTSIMWKSYDAIGMLLATATDTITYNGTTPFELNRTRIIS